MVPTARVYADLCQEAQTASVVELGVCLHNWVTVCEFQTQSLFRKRRKICMIPVFGYVGELRPVTVETCSKLTVR